MKRIGFVIPCYNEAGNIYTLYEQVSNVMKNLENFKYEFIFIDNASTDGTEAILRKLAETDNNASTDGTEAILRKLAETDKDVKVIFNTRNFGHIRSPYYALLQCDADAVFRMAADHNLLRSGRMAIKL